VQQANQKKEKKKSPPSVIHHHHQLSSTRVPIHYQHTSMQGIKKETKEKKIKPEPNNHSRTFPKLKDIASIHGTGLASQQHPSFRHTSCFELIWRIYF